MILKFQGLKDATLLTGELEKSLKIFSFARVLAQSLLYSIYKVIFFKKKSINYVAALADIKCQQASDFSVSCTDTPDRECRIALV